MNIRGSKRVTREAMIYTDALLPLFLKIMVHFYDCLLWSILLCGSNIIITHKKLYLLIDMKIMPKAFGHETTLTSGSNLGHIAPFINPPSGYITFFPIITNSVANLDFSIMGHFTLLRSFLNQVSHTYDSGNQLVKSGNTDLAPSKSNIAKK